VSNLVTVPTVPSAGFLLRLAAASIDLVILLVLLFLGFSSVAGLANLGRKVSLVEPLAFVLGLVVLLTPILYFWFLTGLTGQTVGKKILNIAVRDQHGRAPGLCRSFLREVLGKFVFGLLSIVVPFLLLGFLWIVFDRRRQGWHDKVAGTYVWIASPSLSTPQPKKVSLREPDVLPSGEKPPVRAETITGARSSRSRIIFLTSPLVLLLTGFFVWALFSLFPDYLPLQLAPVKQEDTLPVSVTKPLDARFLILGEANREASKQEWQRLLRVTHGRARVVPLEPVDPTRDLLVFVPGIGVNFQDAHAVARLQDRYQVVIAIYNQKLPLDRNSKYLAMAIKEFMNYRHRLATARGIEPSKELRLIGHSYGCLAGELILANLAEDGLADHGSGSSFSRVLFVCIDGPWRGFDVPWVFTLPGVKHVVRQLLPRVPLPKPATRSSLSVVNRTSSMNAVADAHFPQSVTVRLLTVPPGPTELSLDRRVEPVDSWYSFELAKNELEQIWAFLREGETNWNALERWELGLLIRKQTLQQLMRTLTRDSDYSTYQEDLLVAAREANTLEEFRTHYDALIAKIVDTFQGQHTRFMWENPNFMPWIRKTLNEW
jgi:uncharacterized RDD family membrane protein YckC/pimeloyl-ACP methyl ester carboxylesterase